jgi:hypothetical protein
MMRDNLLTIELGRELLQKQKGDGWALWEIDGDFVATNERVQSGPMAPSIRIALMRVGVVIPDPLWPFIATGLSVIRNGKHIAKAESATMASRIANALNAHKPDKRGR